MLVILTIFPISRLDLQHAILHIINIFNYCVWQLIRLGTTALPFPSFSSSFLGTRCLSISISIRIIFIFFYIINHSSFWCQNWVVYIIKVSLWFYYVYWGSTLKYSSYGLLSPKTFFGCVPKVGIRMENNNTLSQNFTKTKNYP